MRPANRFPLEYPVTIEFSKELIPGQETQAELQIAATSENLSETGMGLHVPNPHVLKTGMEVKSILHFGEPPKSGGESAERLDLHGKVIWVEGDRVGVQLYSIPRESKLFYQTLLDGFEIMSDFRPVGALGFR